MHGFKPVPALDYFQALNTLLSVSNKNLARYRKVVKRTHHLYCDSTEVKYL